MKVLSNLDLQQNRVTNVGNAVDNGDLVTKQQLTAAMEGLKNKASAKTVATSNITLSGEQTIGSTAVVAGDRVLVIGQTNAAENGIYGVSATAWTRTLDANTWDELLGAGIWIDDARAFYRADISNGGTLETDDITFTKVIEHSELPSNLAKKYSQVLTGDGSTSFFEINHNLNVLYPTVSVWDVSSATLVVVEVIHDNANFLAIQLPTAPANGQNYQVTVVG